MAYKKKLDPTNSKTVYLGGTDPDGNANQTSLEGHYLGARELVTDYGPGKLHYFSTKEGIVGVWGKTNLNRLMTENEIGKCCLVEFTGMSKPIKKGRKPSYQFSVSVDDTNTIDVSGVSLNTGSSSDEEEQGSVSDEPESDIYEDETSSDTVSHTKASRRPEPAQLNAEAKAKAQAFLSKNKSA